jgi:hypothetical protein
MVDGDSGEDAADALEDRDGDPELVKRVEFAVVG